MMEAIPLLNPVIPRIEYVPTHGTKQGSLGEINLLTNKIYIFIPPIMCHAWMDSRLSRCKKCDRFYTLKEVYDNDYTCSKCGDKKDKELHELIYLYILAKELSVVSFHELNHAFAALGPRKSCQICSDLKIHKMALVLCRDYDHASPLAEMIRKKIRS